MRKANLEQTLHEFESLDHQPESLKILDSIEVFQCSKCHAWLGSEYGCNPCGDPLGHTLSFIPQFYVYKGQILN